MSRIKTMLNKVTDIQPLLEKLKSGQVIRRTLSIFFRVVAALMGLGCLVFWLTSWLFIGELQFFGGLAFLIWQAAFPLAAFLAVKVLYLRAREIKDFPDADFIVAPVFASLTRASGEMAFIFLGVMSLPAMLLTWLGGRTVTSLLPVLDAGGGAIFMIGIQVFIMSWIIGFLALLLARLAAEYTLAIFTMVNDIGMLRRHVIPADPGAGDQMPVVPGPQSDHPSMVDTETEDQ